MQYDFGTQRFGFGDGGSKGFTMIVAVRDYADFQVSPPWWILPCAAQSIFYGRITFFSLEPYSARLKSAH
jgi:hypothetical protein